jgi:hypothetical protein
LASLLLIAGSIGINIARYPVVWDMVGGLQASAAGAGPQTPEAAEAISGRQGPPDGGQTESVPPTLREDRAAPRPNPPREAVAVEQPLAIPDASRPVRDLAGLRPLAPVILSGPEQGPPDPRGAPSAADGQLRRLPPLDRVAPRPAAAIPAPGDRSLPLSYPSTGL